MNRLLWVPVSLTLILIRNEESREISVWLSLFICLHRFIRLLQINIIRCESNSSEEVIDEILFRLPGESFSILFKLLVTFSQSIILPWSPLFLANVANSIRWIWFLSAILDGLSLFRLFFNCLANWKNDDFFCWFIVLFEFFTKPVDFVGHSYEREYVFIRCYVICIWSYRSMSRALLARMWHSKLSRNRGFGGYWLGKLRPFLKKIT